MTRRSALTLAELLVTSILFSLVSGTLMSALFTVPRWTQSIGDRSDLLREVRIAHLALQRDLSLADTIRREAGALVLETATTGDIVIYRPRLSDDGFRVVALERVDPAGTRTLVARFLTDLEVVESPVGSLWIRLMFRHGSEWRRLVIMTGGRGGGV